MNEIINCINKTEIQPNCILTGLGIKRKTKGLILRHCGDYDCHCDCDCDSDCHCRLVCVSMVCDCAEDDDCCDYDCHCYDVCDNDCNCNCDCNDCEDYDDGNCDCSLQDYVDDNFDGNWDLYEDNMSDD